MFRQPAFAVLVVLVWIRPADAQAPVEFPGTTHRVPAAANQSLPFGSTEVEPRRSTYVTETSPPQRISQPERRITPPSETDSQKPRRGSSPATTVLALTLVLSVILVAARLWKKHGPIHTVGLPSEALEMLGKRQIDSRQSILLVRLGSRVLVLGSSPEGLRTLAEIDDAVEVDLLCGLCRGSGQSDGVSQAFRSLFQKRLGPKERTSPSRSKSRRQRSQSLPEEVHA